MDRRLAAILSADAVGFSRHMARDEEGTARILGTHRQLIRDCVAECGGRVVDDPGDNLLAEFPSVVDAVRSAVQIQEQLERANARLEPERRLLFRIGVNLGDVLVDGERILGDGVNVAARVEGLAEPGGICVSGSAFEQVEGKLALGFEPGGEQVVKNLPKPVRIYRVRRAGEEIPRASSPRRRLLQGAGIAGLLLLAVGIGFALTVRLDSESPPPASAPRPIRSLAVLPLEDLANDPEQAYFAFSMTDALVAELAKRGTLRVVSNTSVPPARSSLPAGEIALRLGVDAVVDGSILRTGGRVRITTRLIDARTDDPLWVGNYERDLSDVLALQREVAREIALQIEGELAPTLEPAYPGPVNPEAYEAYLKGYFHQMKRTRADTLKALGYFQQVIRLDPSSPIGYVALADEYTCAPTHSWSIPKSARWPSVPREMLARGRENAQKALELDPDSGPAHNSIALVRLYGDWDWPGAEAEFLRSLELGPNRSWAHTTYGYLLSVLGRWDEAQRYLETARMLDPLRRETTMDLASFYIWRGDFERAYELWQTALASVPGYPQLHQAVITAFCGGEVHDEALAVLEDATVTYPDDPLVLADLAYCYAVSGRRDDAREILEQLDVLSAETYVSHVGRARAHVGLGETEEALAALEQGYRDRDSLLVHLGLDPIWKPLRGDPRYRDLLERIGLPQAEEVAATARSDAPPGQRL